MVDAPESIYSVLAECTIFLFRHADLGFSGLMYATAVLKAGFAHGTGCTQSFSQDSPCTLLPCDLVVVHI
jgi:hypothetical protein